MHRALLLPAAFNLTLSWLQVLIPAPFWVSYPEMAKLAGAKPVIVDCPADDKFLLTPAALKASLSAASRLLILCSPSNPTGSVYSRCAVSSERLLYATLIGLWVLSLLHMFHHAMHKSWRKFFLER